MSTTTRREITESKASQPVSFVYNTLGDESGRGGETVCRVVWGAVVVQSQNRFLFFLSFFPFFFFFSNGRRFIWKSKKRSCSPVFSTLAVHDPKTIKSPSTRVVATMCEHLEGQRAAIYRKKKQPEHNISPAPSNAASLANTQSPIFCATTVWVPCETYESCLSPPQPNTYIPPSRDPPPHSTFSLTVVVFFMVENQRLRFQDRR